mmetsp:Transcript_30641/g.95215  ORF Transcript_30641/g.95215 Transcript_30641/m.95215 type:complete len:303 (+) Transcript_30641:357-1265(+)
MRPPCGRATSASVLSSTRPAQLGRLPSYRGASRPSGCQLRPCHAEARAVLRRTAARRGLLLPVVHGLRKSAIAGAALSVRAAARLITSFVESMRTLIQLSEVLRLAMVLGSAMRAMASWRAARSDEIQCSRVAVPVCEECASEQALGAGGRPAAEATERNSWRGARRWAPRMLLSAVRYQEAAVRFCEHVDSMTLAGLRSAARSWRAFVDAAAIQGFAGGGQTDGLRDWCQAMSDTTTTTTTSSPSQEEHRYPATFLQGGDLARMAVASRRARAAVDGLIVMILREAGWQVPAGLQAAEEGF